MSKEVYSTPKKEIHITPLRLKPTSPAYNMIGDMAKDSQYSTREHSIDNSTEKDHSMAGSLVLGIMKSNEGHNSIPCGPYVDSYDIDIRRGNNSEFDIHGDEEAMNKDDLNDNPRFYKYSQVISSTYKKKNDSIGSSYINSSTKRRRFNSIEEHQKFVEDYKKKYKTEICKNFEFKGTCHWGDQVNP